MFWLKCYTYNFRNINVLSYISVPNFGLHNNDNLAIQIFFWKACSFSQHEYNLLTDFTWSWTFLEHCFRTPLSGQNVIEIHTDGSWWTLDPGIIAVTLGLLKAAALGRKRAGQRHADGLSAQFTLLFAGTFWGVVLSQNFQFSF